MVGGSAERLAAVPTLREQLAAMRAGEDPTERLDDLERRIEALESILEYMGLIALGRLDPAALSNHAARDE